MAPTRLSIDEDYSKLVDAYDTWLFDCDGVCGEATNQLTELRRVGNFETKRQEIAFVTNAASLSRRSLKTKFDVLGIEAHINEIFGAAYAAAVYLSSVVNLSKEKKVYVIGMKGLEDELHEEGYQTEGGTTILWNLFSLSAFTPTGSIGAVVCGLDTSINYTKISKAFQYLHNSPAPPDQILFISTNPDATYPSAGGLLPGAGSISASLRYALGKDPVVTGKPSAAMLNCIRAKIHYDPERTIMVGDRLDTDILFGQNGGLATLLVLTGITKEHEMSGPGPSSIVPEYVTESLGDFVVAGK